MMLQILVAGIIAPQSGILVIDSLAVGLVENGRWMPMDKQTGISERVEQFTKGTCFSLGTTNTIQPTSGSLAFGGEDAGPGERGWVLNGPLAEEDNVIWFGSAPSVPNLTVIPNNSSTYNAAVVKYLEGKGFKHPTPYLHRIVQADLDGNGTNEVLIFASSRMDADMHETQRLMNEPKFPKDYSVVLIRYSSGGKQRMHAAYYTDGKKGPLEGHCKFAGLWNLDDKPGLEVLYRWSGYEAWSGAVVGFANGSSTILAEAGDGV